MRRCYTTVTRFVLRVQPVHPRRVKRGVPRRDTRKKKRRKRRERPGGGAVGKGGPERREQPGRTDNQATARQTGTATPSPGDHRGRGRDVGTRRRKTQFFVTLFLFH